MARIGITGGIGCGKSAFTGMFAPLVSAQSVDTDEIAHLILDGNPEVREQVCARWGSAVCDAGGRIDRTALRNVIFNSPAEKQALERILHPKIREAWLKQAEASSAANANIVIQIPLLFETGAEKAMDCVITVAASEETQIARLTASRGITPATAKKMIHSQLPMAEKCRRADHAVWNNGPLELLERQARLLTQLF